MKNKNEAQRTKHT